MTKNLKIKVRDRSSNTVDDGSQHDSLEAVGFSQEAPLSTKNNNPTQTSSCSPDKVGKLRGGAKY